MATVLTSNEFDIEKVLDYFEKNDPKDKMTEDIRLVLECLCWGRDVALLGDMVHATPPSFNNQVKGMWIGLSERISRFHNSFAEMCEDAWDDSEFDFHRLSKAEMPLDSVRARIFRGIRLVLIASFANQDLVMEYDVVEPGASSVLEGITSPYITVRAVRKFVAKHFFKEGVTRGVRIIDISTDFRRRYLGKVETDIRKGVLEPFGLNRGAYDRKIIADLAERHSVAYIVEIALAHMWQAMAAQPNGEDGPLFTDGRRNVFFPADIRGKVTGAGISYRKSSFTPPEGGWRIHTTYDESEWRGDSKVYRQHKDTTF